MKTAPIRYNTAVEATLDVIGGKWKPVILFHLSLGKRRNAELRRLLPTVSQKVLTEQLRQLENDGIITRTIYPQLPPKVEYALSEFGLTLTDVLTALCRWGDIYLEHTYGQAATVLLSKMDKPSK